MSINRITAQYVEIVVDTENDAAAGTVAECDHGLDILLGI